MKKADIDDGIAFDWGKTSKDYAKYRDIYPTEFYERLLQLGIGTKGQKVLDLGTGTGVLPRNMAKYGASFVGVDISKEQIEQAHTLSEGDIDYVVSPSEDIDFPTDSFDVVTACQCFFYFDVDSLLPKLKKFLKPDGLLAIIFLAWLPAESEIAARTEELVLKYSPKWTGANMDRTLHAIPNWLERYDFEVVENIGFDVAIPFTTESWNGRIKACRGVGASLDEDQVADFEKEHLAMLAQLVEEEPFDISHFATVLVLKNK